MDAGTRYEVMLVGYTYKVSIRRELFNLYSEGFTGYTRPSGGNFESGQMSCNENTKMVYYDFVHLFV